MTNTPLNPYYVISSRIWCKILNQENQEVINNFTEEKIKRNSKFIKARTSIEIARKAQ